MDGRFANFTRPNTCSQTVSHHPGGRSADRLVRYRDLPPSVSRRIATDSQRSAFPLRRQHRDPQRCQPSILESDETFDDLLHGPHAAGVTSGLEQAEDTARTPLPGRWHSTPGVFRLSDLAFSDYNPTSDGNLFRIDRLVDSLQSASGDRPADQAVGSRPGPLAPLHRMIDGLQTLRLEISNSGQRILVEAVDDSLAGWLESVADLVINTDHRVPAEIVVPLDAEVVRQASRTRSPEPAAP
ncbi:MAG: hypothetical protein CM1200mP2_45860 [Planctomycetaceae bacterium]|nr:MAG: hypothetical protein CM1200mP2_45860 [Planctomycetaceae bacterium]